MPRLILTCVDPTQVLAADREVTRLRLPVALNSADGGTWAVVRSLAPRVDSNHMAPEAAAASRRVFVEAPGDMEAPAWLPGARASVEAAIDAVEHANPAASLILWPHAAGAISDAPSLRTFLRTRGVAAGGRWRFVYDPAALTTAAMVANAEDHLARWREVLLTHPDLAAVVVGERSAFDAGSDESQPQNETGTFLRLVTASLAGLEASVPVVLVGEVGEDQRNILASAGLL